ncbi:UNVERIFIED_CONTAM: Lama1 [Trichonephila clavipes]
MIQQARENTREASRLADSADAKARRVRKQHELTQLNLKELKDKILLARQKASSIKVGLTSDVNGQCVRSYNPTVEPSTTNNIILNYATKSNAKDSLLFFIGSSKEAPSEIRSSSFSGCLYEVLFDGRPIGLWNFVTNIGCDGSTEDIDTSAFEFQGSSSYAIVPQVPYYKKSDLYTVLSFKTLNEDALLFLSCNKERGQVISLELKGGKVVYQLTLDGRTHIRLQTNKKYNTGQWIRVEAARENFEAQLLVEEEFLENTLRGSSSALELSDSSLYYGGVPPNFTKESWPDINFSNFFGCMKDIQIDSTPIDLFKGSFYGMNVGCSNRPLKVATFKGEGYIELNGQPLPLESSITFSFLTSQSDGLLLVSTFKGQESTKRDQQQNYYSIALKDERIVAMFNGGSGEIQMTSVRTIKRNTFHTVNIIRKNRSLMLRLDDETESDIQLPRALTEIASPKKGGLFFGGIKRGIDVSGITATQQPFIGIIQDVVFNDKLLRFDDLIRHKGVDFGQPDMQSVSEEIFQKMAPSSPGENCATNVLMEDDAVSLQSEKSAEIYLNKKDITNNFNISVDYRTFYPTGNVISLSNSAKKLYLSMFLEKGLIKLYYMHRKERKTEKSDSELAIGKWHQILILKEGRHLTVFLDKQKSIFLNVPKRLPFKVISIGGISNTSASMHKLHGSFRGCFRNMRVNAIAKKIPSDSSCFKHVDFGTYFTGSGYIVQDHAFHLGERLDLSFQFRTINYNGIIFSIFSKFSGIWFELSLKDEMVIAALYNEDDLNLELSQKLKADSSCDYKWHDIKMDFYKNYFALHVDGLKPVEQKIENIPTDFNFAEIYIGGKPDHEKY